MVVMVEDCPNLTSRQVLIVGSVQCGNRAFINTILGVLVNGDK